MRRVLAAVAVVVLCLVPVVAQELYQVERVVNGDSVVLTGLGNVRLIGVELPSAITRQSTAFLAGVLLHRKVRVEFDTVRADSNNRPLVYLFLDDGTFVNRELVRMGYAHAFLSAPFKHSEGLRAAAIEARDARREIWAMGIPGTATVEPLSAAARQAAALASQPSPPLDSAQPRTTVVPARRVAPSAPTRCAATTQKGSRCLRNAQAGRAYCWQH